MMRRVLGVAGVITIVAVAWISWPSAEGLEATGLRVFICPWAAAALIWMLHMLGALRTMPSLFLAIGLVLGAGAVSMALQGSTDASPTVIAVPLLAGLVVECARIHRAWSADSLAPAAGARLESKRGAPASSRVD